MVSHDSETPARGQQVITACALIHHSFNGVEKVFLAKRAATKKFLPNKYELPGGHIHFGEDLLDGLKREIMEELGVRINVEDPVYAFTYLNAIKASHSVEIVFMATLLDEPDRITLHPQDHSSGGWFAKDELDKIFQTRRKDDPENNALLRGFFVLEKYGKAVTNNPA